MSMNGENVYDNWEDIDENELSNKLVKLKEESNKMNTSQLNGPVKIFMLPDDDTRPQYVSSEPTVKILRRPTPDIVGDKSYTDKPKIPKKTLQQREQEYAEARLRILGSAKNPEEDDEQRLIRINGSSENSLTIARSININPTTSSGYENVIRMPKGPDGTIGFTMRR